MHPSWLFQLFTCSLIFLFHKYAEGICEFAQGAFLSSKDWWERKLNTDPHLMLKNVEKNTFSLQWKWVNISKL